MVRFIYRYFFFFSHIFNGHNYSVNFSMLVITNVHFLTNIFFTFMERSYFWIVLWCSDFMFNYKFVFFTRIFLAVQFTNSIVLICYKWLLLTNVMLVWSLENLEWCLIANFWSWNDGTFYLDWYKIFFCCIFFFFFSFKFIFDSVL